jgi:hypothetical protein
MNRREFLKLGVFIPFLLPIADKAIIQKPATTGDIINTKEIVGNSQKDTFFGVLMDAAKHNGMGGRIIFINTLDPISPEGALILDGSTEDTLIVSNRAVHKDGWQTIIKVFPDKTPKGYRSGIQLQKTPDINNAEFLDIQANDTEFVIGVNKSGENTELRDLVFKMGDKRVFTIKTDGSISFGQ